MKLSRKLFILLIAVWSLVALGLIFLIIVLANGGTLTTTNQAAQSNMQIVEAPEDNEAAKAEPAASETPKPTAQFPTYGAGTYKIGADLVADEYVIYAAGASCYYEVASDSSGELNSIVNNGNVDTFTLVTVEDGEYLTVKRGGIFSLNEYIEDNLDSINRVGLREDGTYGPGTYKIGTMLPEGEYRLESIGGSSYMARLEDSRGVLDSIIANENFNDNVYVTVYNGEYLEVKRANIVPVTE